MDAVGQVVPLTPARASLLTLVDNTYAFLAMQNLAWIRPAPRKRPEPNPSIVLILPSRPTTLLRGIVRNQLRGRCAPSTAE
jgi:hypothetical protein